MYTIDMMIERLLELKAISSGGGHTPVVINQSTSDSDMESVAVELEQAQVTATSAATGKPVCWRVASVQSDCEVVRVY